MNIIGIGQAGCQVAKQFEKYSQYETYFVDTKKQKQYGNFFKVVPRSSHEEYEEKYKSLPFKKITGDVTLVVSGSGKISGILLRVLEQLKNKKVSILYIKPDLKAADKKAKTREKIVFGILQQYARSNLISQLFVFSNLKVESVLNNVSIQNYWNDINNVISSTYHMYNVFENTEPILSTLSEPAEVSKISTFGVLSFDKLDEKTFYDLEKPRLKKYFFGVSEETLNQEKDLLQKIRGYVDSNAEENCSTCFAIYPTIYEQDYAYTVHHASFVQEQNLVDT